MHDIYRKKRLNHYICLLSCFSQVLFKHPLSTGSIKYKRNDGVTCTCPSVQFSSAAQLCPALCDPMNRSMPGLPVHHQLTEFTETHVH